MTNQEGKCSRVFNFHLVAVHWNSESERDHSYSNNKNIKYANTTFLLEYKEMMRLAKAATGLKDQVDNYSE